MAILASHVCKIHRYDPNFLIYCSSCLRSFKVWDTYKKHLYRGCKDVANSTIPEINGDATEDEDITDYLELENDIPSKSIRCGIHRER